jgi:hypothetical protein
MAFGNHTPIGRENLFAPRYFVDASATRRSARAIVRVVAARFKFLKFPVFLRRRASGCEMDFCLLGMARAGRLNPAADRRAARQEGSIQ